MTQEEKAKAYDEALEIAKKNYVTAQDLCEGSQIGVECFKNTLESIFPELKVNTDERIREALIALLKFGLEDNSAIAPGFNETKEQALAWLEKQDIFSKKDVDDAYLKGVADTKNEIEKQYEANYQIRKDIATFIFNYKGDIKDRAKWMNYLGIKVSFYEKQSEQKPDWSEEDEKMVKDIIAAIDSLYYHGMVNWLKSLKERIGR